MGYDCVADPAAKLEYDLVLPVGWATKPEAFAGANLAAGQGAYEIEDDALLAALKEKILPKGNRSDPKRNVLESETGELFIDGANDVMVLDTPRTAGGYAPDGKAVEAPRGGVRAVMAGSDATVWVSALDDRPITSSKRLLVTHLTDLQNTEIRYGERARQTLLEWGKLPHLVRAGRAEVRVKLDEPGAYKVWSLATNGKRVAELKPEVKDGALVFTADVAAGGEEEGARMLYEIARE
ncbi:MAG: hypothetical protein M5U26_27620 [Planctomycetota bacterium]|nr:hypothetical protein [Planctomycetota bacterium]